MTGISKSIALAVALAAGVTSQVAAQSNGVPAEFPPSSFDGSQYVDSDGCAFVRAGMDGRTNWVPRVDRRRNQLCNFQPTFAQAQQPAAPASAQDAPVVTATAAPRATPSPAARPAAAPRRAPVPQAVAPAVRTARAAPTPRVVAPAPPQPRRMSLAQACTGRFGVQPGFVSSATGQPIDCGPAPRVATVPPPAVIAAPRPQRITLAQACARIAGGERLVGLGGTPIVCPQAAPVRVAAAQPGTTVASNGCAISALNTTTRYPVRCGPQTESPSGIVSRGVGSPARTAMVSSRSVGTPFSIGRPQVPASNPTFAATPAAPVPGYERVWSDGRINPQRGVAQARGLVVVAPQATVSSRSVAPVTAPAPRAASTGHRYVQVGSFGDPANATRLIGRLQAAGLPVASGKSDGLKVIAAGPFASASDLQRALGIVRSMGFADAYTRG